MKRARLALLLLTAAAVGSAPLGSHASLDPTVRATCGPRITCRTIEVPLEWGNPAAGTIGLHVEVSRPPGPSRGVMFLLAGGPGQASTAVFDLYPGSSWHTLLPSYTLVTFDPRGTGGSQPLHCATLIPARSHSASALGRCARSLGAARDYYRTTDNARDLDGVRHALGFRRIGIYGASYGTAVALTYARLFPDRIDRLLLDSIANPLATPAVVSRILRSIPAALRAYCRAACSGALARYPHDAVALANAIARHPLRGSILGPNGGRHVETVDAIRLLGLLISSDSSAGLAAELPIAVDAARRGRPGALLRLAALVEPTTRRRHVNALYNATVCGDGGLPWQPDAPLDSRRAALQQALNNLPAGWSGQFGDWARTWEHGFPAACLGWPPTARPVVEPPDHYPDVPVLAVSGAYDMRSPGSESRSALSHFPHGELLVVAAAGHTALANGRSSCASSAVHAWLAGSAVPRTCAASREVPLLAALPPERRAGSAAGSTLTIVRQTLAEAKTTAAMLSGTGRRIAPGLAGGRLRLMTQEIKLSGYSDSSGVALSGFVTLSYSSVHPRTLGIGLVTVRSGRRDLGVLGVRDGVLEGTLEGRAVTGGRLVNPATFLRNAGGWSAWSPPGGKPESVTQAIAVHIAARYHLDSSGTRLVNVVSAPPRWPRFRNGRPIVVLAFQGQDGLDRFEPSATAWTYSLCGQGPSCAIKSGTPSTARFGLLEREALELALYSFRFVSTLDTVAVYLPPPPGSVPGVLVLFQRDDLMRQLREPLRKTLPLATPPLPTERNVREQASISRLAGPHLYSYSLSSSFPSGDILFLSRIG
jgi:pimeloyl-ACP methyl ester carboxylesterase